MAFRLRFTLSSPVGRKLRVIFYARYSTEEQDASSIPDQIAFCKRFLQENAVPDYDTKFISDAEMSGELVYRPGINELRELIQARKCDLVVCEDSGRLFRHVTACGQLIETAVDMNIRVICINDDVDTAEDDYEERLFDALRHHARSNKYTSKRIKRRLDSLWNMGAAIGFLRAGYRRVPTVPVTATEPAKGPFFDEEDPKWAPIVREAFERIARNDRPSEVAHWVSEQGLPKLSNATTAEWTGDQIVRMIRNSVYRGIEVYRKEISKKKRGTGKPQPVRNAPEDVLQREMPHLRIISDLLWYTANQAIDARRTREKTPTGDDHPLAGIPRDSRGPLSGIILCGICNAKMRVDGRPDGGYRCSKASRGKCWNKTNPGRTMVHEKLGKAIADRLLSLDGALDLVISEVLRLLENGPQQDRRRMLLKKRAKMERAHSRIFKAIETSNKPIASLTERLTKREEEIARVNAELESLEQSDSLRRQIPDKQEIRNAIMEKAKRLLNLDRFVRADLRQLVGTIRTSPYQQFETSSVFLRARCELRLAALLPNQLLLLINQNQMKELEGETQTIPMNVDLFEITRGPARYWAKAVELHSQGKTSDEIAKELGTNRATANRSVRYGQELLKAGLTDPLVELMAPPAKIGKWKLHANFSLQAVANTSSPDHTGDESERHKDASENPRSLTPPTLGPSIQASTIESETQAD